METIAFCFDIDGTIRSNTVDQNKAPVANEDIRTLLIILSKFKNVHIRVWSGSGELYVRQVVASLGLDSYIDSYSSKYDKGFPAKVTKIVAVDDMQDTALGLINLIVDRNKF
jgi:hypothetical protein